MAGRCSRSIPPSADPQEIRDEAQRQSHGHDAEWTIGERIVCTELFDDAWYEGEALHTVTFVEASGALVVDRVVRDHCHRCGRRLDVRVAIDLGDLRVETAHHGGE